MRSDDYLSRLARGASQPGVRSTTGQVLLHALTPLGIVATVMQIAGTTGQYLALGAAGLLGVLWGVHRLALPASRTIRLPNIGSRIVVRTGDLLAEPSHKVVAVGELFDWEIGDRVSRSSLQGQCIFRLFNGDGAKFRDQVDGALRAQGEAGIIWRDGERLRFPIGTTAVLDTPPHRLFLPALTHSDVDNNWKASASPVDLWTTLDSLWRSVRIRANGEPVAIPVIGSGLANVGLPPASVLHFIIQSFVKASSEARVTEQLTIVLTDALYSAVDLRCLG